MNTPFAILAAFLALAPGPDELLPEAPPGWRYERIDFPLAFAPELEYEGFEELRFAPGMFDPQSDSYFSYVLGIRLAEDVRVDTGFVQTFLEAYYLGLCRAVGESRNLDLDLSGFAVEVEGVGRDFHATVDMVDAFVTGEPVRLSLELSVHQGPRTTELFGAASPLPKDSAIWEELDAMAESWRAALSAPVFLNHVYFVPDPETYEALRSSELLRGELGAWEERTTVRKDLSYTGIYFYGRDTYFEFLRADETTGFTPGSSGIAFGLEAEGATVDLAERLRADGAQVFPGPVTRELGGEHVPWFEILGVEGAHERSRLSLFYLEYDPRFLASWHAGLPPEAGGIARSAVLERYAAVLDQTDDRTSGLFEDVAAVHLALDVRECERLFQLCRVIGWVVEPEGESWICDGPQVRFVVSASEAPGGITRFDLTLRREVERETVELGKARLSFEGSTASFVFE